MNGGTPAARLYFIGVTTKQSSIRSVFPLWADALDLDAEIVGRDVSIGASEREYRHCVEELREDARAAGALITSHKAAVYEAARDLFVSLDSYASRCREVSCITRSDGELAGFAKDPITAASAIQEILSDSTSGMARDVVCFGAGGAGIAITVSLLERPDPPRRIVLVDRDARRIDAAREIHNAGGHPVRVDYCVSSSAAENDALLAQCSPGALVINATGMGKDVPGAPISSHAVFPPDSVVWDLNYRGELEFLEFASNQAGKRRLQLADGWQYFLHGWSEVIAEVFGLSITPDCFERLAAIAEAQRERVSRPVRGATTVQ